jgi:hypothetical protein
MSSTGVAAVGYRLPNWRHILSINDWVALSGVMSQEGSPVLLYSPTVEPRAGCAQHQVAIVDPGNYAVRPPRCRCRAVLLVAEET